MWQVGRRHQILSHLGNSSKGVESKSQVQEKEKREREDMKCKKRKGKKKDDIYKKILSQKTKERVYILCKG